MYIRWKVLAGLSFLFWASLCLFDAYFIDPRTGAFYYTDADVQRWKEETELYEKLKLAEQRYGYGSTLAFWNLTAFLATIATCWAIKIGLQVLEGGKNPPTKMSRSVHNQKAVKKHNSDISDDWLLLSDQDASKDYFEEELDKLFTDDVSPIADLNLRSSKSDISGTINKHADLRCAQLRDAMLIQRTNSLKEHAVLQRRLETVSREKRDLCRQLMSIKKENRVARHQLEELIEEKEMLVKRLECASREFRVNSKEKRDALGKLEEALGTISDLRRQLDVANRERDVLENRIRSLDSEQKLEMERLKDTGSSKSDSDYKGRKENAGKTHVQDVGQSQRDVERVQMRLENLEKSINKLKLSNYTSGSNEDIQNASSARTDKRMAPPKVPQEAADSSDASSSAAGALRRHDAFEPSIGDPFDRVGIVLNSIKCLAGSPRCPVDGRNVTSEVYSNINKNFTTSDDTPCSQEETSEDNTGGDNWTSGTDSGKSGSRKLVSNSPAFLKFLRKLDTKAFDGTGEEAAVETLGEGGTI